MAREPPGTNADLRVAPPARLDSEQSQLLALLAQGLKLSEAAESLQLAPRTAERRLAAARSLLGARTTAHAVALADLSSRSSARPSLRGLNARELQILEAIASGLTSREIAVHLGATSALVDALVRSALAKLDARTRVQAVALTAGRRSEKLAGFIDESPGSPA